MKFTRLGAFRRTLLALLAAVVALTSTAIAAPPAHAADDQLTQLALRRLAVFTNWLQTHQVPGVIGEVGWPGDRGATEQAKWNALASRWYEQAAAKNIPVAYWGTGEASMLDPFQNGDADAQISVVRRQPPKQRGMNLGGGEYPGGSYPSEATIKKAAAAGVTWVRLPFRWETIQPQLMGALNESEVGRLQSVVSQILANDMLVELDNHNYNRHNGSTATGAQLGDFWRRLAPRFADQRVSFGLMNEPYPPADANWEAVSQAALDALRSTGSRNLVSVSAKHWSNAHRWSCHHPRPWINDPANNYRYEAHTYFDAANEGRYTDSYDNTYAQAQSRGGVSGAYECPFNSSDGPPPPSPGGSNPEPSTPSTNPTTGNPTDGYRVTTANGQVYGFGTQAQTYGNAPPGYNIVALENGPNDRGYWLVASSGHVFAFGSAVHHGDMAGRRLNAPVVDMTAKQDGSGYWLLGADGGVFSFGSAVFHGSTGNMTLNKPVVGMTAASDGTGYWFVASDGGVFAFGVPFHGSTGGMRLNQPVVGMAAGPNRSGYWLVASDGGVFAFGVPFHGSTGALRLNAPIVGMVGTENAQGYRFVATDGGVFSFGNAPFYGSLGSTSLPSPVRAIGS